MHGNVAARDEALDKLDSLVDIINHLEYTGVASSSKIEVDILHHSNSLMSEQTTLLLNDTCPDKGSDRLQPSMRWPPP